MAIQASRVPLPDAAPKTTEPGRYARAFIDQLLADGETVSDLSRRMDLSRDEERKLYKWARAESGPNMIATIKLLRFAGLLAVEPLEASLSAPQARVVPPEGIEAAAAAIVAEMHSGFGKLDARLQRLEKRRASAASRSQSKAAGDR